MRVGTALVVTSLCCQAPAQTLASTGFDSGPEGWTYACHPACTGGTGIEWLSSGGNPGGYLFFDDPGTGTSVIKAPPEYLGDWSILDGVGLLEFQHRVEAHSTGCGHSSYRAQISGPGGVAVWHGFQAKDSAWVDVVVPIHQELWAVTAGSWSGLLRDVTELCIFAEVIDNGGPCGNTERCGIDNISLGTHCPLEVRRFQQGVDHGSGPYLGTRDTVLSGLAPTTNYCTSELLVADEASQYRASLLRFEDIIGHAPGQVPTGADILYASIRFIVPNTSTSDSAGHHSVHRILQTWDECTATFQNSFGGDGISANGVEASNTALANIGALELGQTARLDITEAMQAWVNGAPGHGIALLPGTTDALALISSDAVDSARRPRLDVVYSAGPCVFTYCPCDVPPPGCGNGSPNSGCTNSTGSGAAIESSGSTSVALDDLTIEVTGAPPFASGILFMGGGPTVGVPFGDGLLCVGPGVASLCRYPIQNSGASGVISEGPGLVALSQTFSANCHIQAGETWYFQAWFRDPSGPCGSAFNLSDALAVTFAP